MIGLLQGEGAGWKNRVAETEEGVSFSRNTIVRTLSGFALLPILASFGILAFFVRQTETLLILHYNVYFGVDLLGAWWQAYVLPVLSLLFFSVHLLLAYRFYRNAERIAAYLLLLASSLIGFGALIASISVAFINY